MVTVAISLGTNLGDRRAYMQIMLEYVKRVLQKPLVISSLMETEPLGFDEPVQWFLNRIVSGQYDGNAYELLEYCLEAERNLGRTRGDATASRTADIDILLFGKEVIANTNLTIPHPHMLKRRFCMEGLMETVPGAYHPLEKTSVENLYRRMGECVKNHRIRVID
jgi:2-amino-4-hydroxy-6-hydroxymethyldihydropteridine diphosphokinase